MKFELLFSRKRSIALITFVVSIIIITAGAYYFRYEESIIREAKEKELESIGKLKCDQISDWFTDQIDDASSLANNIFLSEKIYAYQKSKSEKDKILLKQFLLSIQHEHGLKNIIVVSSNYDVLISADNIFSKLDSIQIVKVKEALNNNSTVSTDLYLNKTENLIELDFISPVVSESGASDYAILFKINPSDFLYPLIQTWPISSRSSETLIFRRENDRVIFLNELRHAKNTALKLSIPLTESEVPAVMGAKGKTGIHEGKDYRGVDVLSVILPVENTAWIMIAKVDKDEIYSELMFRAVFISIITVVFVLFVGLGFAFIYKYKQSDVFKRLFNKEKELRENVELFKTTLYSIGDGVITTDGNARVKNMNIIAEQLTGWSEGDAINKSIEDVFDIINEDSRSKVENPVDRVLNEGIIVGLANHTILVSKTGHETPIADSGAPIKDADGKIIGVVLVFRDQTIEHNAKKELEESRNLLMHTQEVAMLGSYTWDILTGLWTSSKILDEIFGIDENYNRTLEGWVNIIHPEYQKIMNDYVIAEVIGENQRFDKEYKIKRIKDGAIRWVHGLGNLEYDNKNNPVKLIGTISDITERKIIQEQIEESEKRYRQLVNSMEQGIALHEMIYDMNGNPSDYRFIEINKSFEKLTGLKREDIIGRTVYEVMPKTEKYWIEAYGNVVKTGESLHFQNYAEELNKYYDVVAFKPRENQFAVIVSDVTEKRRADEEREITIQLLAVINAQNNSKKLMEDVILLMKEWSGCESVGIRLKDNEDYPYIVSSGFTKEFIEKENYLCARDQNGNAKFDSSGKMILECMCGNIISRKFNPEKSFFTENGSFWTNSTSELLRHATNEDRLVKTRNRCFYEGYESVALIPLNSADETFGLLQFNDKNKNKFNEGKISLFERLANNLAIAIAQKKMQAELKVSEIKHRTLFETMLQGVAYINQEGRIISANSAASNILGVETEHLGDYLVYDEYWKATNEEGKLFQKDEFPAIISLRTGKEVNNIIMRIYNSNEHRNRWININAIPQFKNGDKLPYQVLTTFEDITERKLSEERITNSLKEKEVLLKEIHHRVKNNFQIITSLLNLQSDLISDEKIQSVFADSQNRIKSMSLIHELMYKSESFSKINLSNYFSNLIEYLKLSYSDNISSVDINIDIDDIEMQLDTLVPIGLIVNETVSNAFKYAFPEKGTGEINIVLKKSESNFYVLHISDTGIGIPKGFDFKETKSLGMFLVNTLVKQIKGELKINSGSSGTDIRIKFELD